VIPAMGLGVEDGLKVWVVVELGAERGVLPISLGVVHDKVVETVPLGVINDFVVGKFRGVVRTPASSHSSLGLLGLLGLWVVVHSGGGHGHHGAPVLLRLLIMLLGLLLADGGHGSGTVLLPHSPSPISPRVTDDEGVVQSVTLRVVDGLERGVVGEHVLLGWVSTISS